MKRTMRSRLGFTLIELLVVVLIIGILAAVALPQYQKAVMKARFGEVQVIASNLMKATDLYILEHGAHEAYFFEPDKNAELDISIPCIEEKRSRCYTKLGTWMVECFDDGNCAITFISDPEGEGNSWLEAAGFMLAKHQNQAWKLSELAREEGKGARLICDWWKNNYGSDRISNEACSNVE